jgi:DNA polymerase-3 subunit epsilon
MVVRSETAKRPEAWLDRVTSKMPRVENPAVESYVDVLERALLDGHLSDHEKRDLIDLAVELGLQRDQMDQVHEVYLKVLAATAWADDVVTEEERTQLLHVAAALGFSEEVADGLLDEARGTTATFDLPALHLLAGDRIVFTGELSRPREDWIARIEGLGLESGSITKATRVVVAADPDSLSGKAAKARGYGVPIITEAAFDGLISAMENRRDSRSRALSD